jgi:hypothetical protein
MKIKTLGYYCIFKDIESDDLKASKMKDKSYTKG